MELLLDMTRRRGPLLFFLSTVLTVAVFGGLGYLVMHTVGADHHLSGLAIFMCILLAVFALIVLMTQFVQRLNDARWPGFFAILAFIPAVNIGLWLLLLVLPSRKPVQTH